MDTLRSDMMQDRINADFPLVYDNITLSLLTPAVRQSLTELSADRKIWQYAYQPLWEPAVFAKWLDKAFLQLQQGIRYPFLIQQQQVVVGSTSFYQIDTEHKRVAIGYTWYHPSYWGTALNRTVKYLLLSYVFEALAYHRVTFMIDITNQRSQHAVLKLGATQEGILRKHMIRPDGSHRDTVVMSIIDSDWPEIKHRLLLQRK